MRGWKWMALGLAVLLLLAGGGAWLERASLRTWWVLRGLKKADESERELWVGRVADLGEPAVDGLLECLDEGDDRARDNAVAALDHLARTWGADDPRTADLAGKLARAYGKLCPAAQACLLERMAAWFDDRPPSPGLVSACSRLLGEAATNEEALGAALELARALLRHPQTCEAVRSAREAARAGLRSPSAEDRLQAVRLGMLPGVDLLHEIAVLVADPDVDVRRAVVVAIGPSDQGAHEKELLGRLHDPDAKVRRLAEEALKGRGVSAEHLLLGKLLAHPAWSQRLRVLDYLSDESHTLDVGLWLRRMSHDPSPAVRAAALRVMSQQRLIDLSDRIDQMAQSDPSPAVAFLARHYLDQARAGSRPR
jgi:HEAT repeat protein